MRVVLALKEQRVTHRLMLHARTGVGEGRIPRRHGAFHRYVRVVHVRLRISLLVGWQHAGRQYSHRCSGVAAAVRKSVLAALAASPACGVTTCEENRSVRRHIMLEYEF
jgi:hypothetical protein